MVLRLRQHNIGYTADGFLQLISVK